LAVSPHNSVGFSWILRLIQQSSVFFSRQHISTKLLSIQLSLYQVYLCQTWLYQHMSIKFFSINLPVQTYFCRTQLYQDVSIEFLSISKPPYQIYLYQTELYQYISIKFISINLPLYQSSIFWKNLTSTICFYQAPLYQLTPRLNLPLSNQTQSTYLYHSLSNSSLSTYASFQLVSIKLILINLPLPNFSVSPCFLCSKLVWVVVSVR
jgi:hypothetical protein